MFQSIQPDEIFDLSKAQASEGHPSYWLAQLRKADWLYLLKFVDMKLPVRTKKQTMAEVALRYFEFVLVMAVAKFGSCGRRCAMTIARW